jgi:serine/threonine protein kinase
MKIRRPLKEPSSFPWSTRKLTQFRRSEFDVYQKIGEGVTSDVNISTHIATGVEVVIKSMKPALITDEGAQIRFGGERNLLLGLQSLIEHGVPIVPILIGTMGELVNVDGINMVIRSIITLYIPQFQPMNSSIFKSINEDDLISVSYNLISAVGKIHDLDIAHRDIKPANILITVEDMEIYPNELIHLNHPIHIRKWDIQLIDFGSACRHQCHGSAGTPSYHDPTLYQYIKEYILESESMNIDIDMWKSGDWWSTGFTLYKLINGFTDVEKKALRGEFKTFRELARLDPYIYDPENNPDDERVSRIGIPVFHMLNRNINPEEPDDAFYYMFSL